MPHSYAVEEDAVFYLGSCGFHVSSPLATATNSRSAEMFFYVLFFDFRVSSPLPTGTNFPSAKMFF